MDEKKAIDELRAQIKAVRSESAHRKQQAARRIFAVLKPLGVSQADFEEIFGIKLLGEVAKDGGVYDV